MCKLFLTIPVLASEAATVTIGEHTCVAQGEWQYDANEHWKFCTCGTEVDRTAHSGGTATCSQFAVCDICGEEYGEVNVANHTNLVKTETKPATATAAGNTEYWYCDGCGKYFSDEAGTKEISLEDTVIPKMTEDTNTATGDDSNMLPVIAVMVLAAAGAAAAVIYRRREE